jgi:uncharacterized membrane protein/thiol-disulfide isomerase/thioredoxin
MRIRLLQRITLSIFVSMTVLLPVAARAESKSVVQAVLFYSPNCSHCHYVIAELLEPMLADYGDQLQIVRIDASQMSGSKLYHAAIERYGDPSRRRAVPMLVVGDVVLIGSREIPDQFPALVEEGLAAGGISWPDIPGLADLLAGLQSEPSPAPAPAAAMLDAGEVEVPPAEDQGHHSDPLGFVLAGVILAGMAISFGYSFWRISRPFPWRRLVQYLTWDRTPMGQASTWVIPVLALVGLVVASYLAYVEVTHTAAVCGPVGECNVVQTSAYALFLGVPVAVWGVLNYLAVVALWAGQRTLPGRLAHLSLLGLLGLTIFGTLFSIYLTYLEIFAIQAICSWCLSSAVITTALMLLATHAVMGMEPAFPRRSGARAGQGRQGSHRLSKG